MNKCVEQHMYKIATLHMASPKGKEKCLRKKNKFSRSLLMSVFALSRKKKHFVTHGKVSLLRTLMGVNERMSLYE